MEFLLGKTGVAHEAFALIFIQNFRFNEIKTKKIYFLDFEDFNIQINNINYSVVYVW